MGTPWRTALQVLTDSTSSVKCERLIGQSIIKSVSQLEANVFSRSQGLLFITSISSITSLVSQTYSLNTLLSCIKRLHCPQSDKWNGMRTVAKNVLKRSPKIGNVHTLLMLLQCCPGSWLGTLKRFAHCIAIQDPFFWTALFSLTEKIQASVKYTCATGHSSRSSPFSVSQDVNFIRSINAQLYRYVWTTFCIHRTRLKSTLVLITAIANAAPVSGRWHIVAPLLSEYMQNVSIGTPRTVRWNEALAFLSTRTKATVKDVRSWSQLVTLLFHLPGFFTVAPALAHALSNETNEMQVNQLVTMFLSSGLVKKASRYMQSTPFSCRAKDIVEILGKVFTPGFVLDMDSATIVTLRFMIKLDTGESILLSKLNFPPPALQDFYVNDRRCSHADDVSVSSGDLLQFHCHIAVSVISQSNKHVQESQSPSLFNKQNSAFLSKAILSRRQSAVDRRSMGFSKDFEMTLTIIYEDSELMVLAKPNALDVVNFIGQSKPSVVNIIASFRSDIRLLPRWGVVHRIDGVTSGLVILAKQPKSFYSLSNQFLRCQVRRAYLCLCIQMEASFSKANRNVHVVSTCHENISSQFPTTGVIHSTHGFAGERSQRIQVSSTDVEESTAFARYHVIETFPRASCLFLRCELDTGKKHQIRAQLAGLGIPILGDIMYGGSGVATPVAPIGHIFLHASELCFSHSDDIEGPLIFELSLPLWFQSYLDNLRKVNLV